MIKILNFAIYSVIYNFVSQFLQLVLNWYTSDTFHTLAIFFVLVTMATFQIHKPNMPIESSL